MKKVFLSVMCVLFGVSFLCAQDPTGDDIIRKVNDILAPASTWAKAKMKILTTSGDKRTFIYESWSKNRGEKNLVRYLEPSRVKGQAVLMLNHADDIWMFFPRTQRVRKLATHAKRQKMQGSDFSYEDMGSGDAFIEDFSTSRLEDEKAEGSDCYKLELIRQPESDVSYSRLILWAVKETYVPVVIDYYDDKDPERRVKRLVASDIRFIDDIPTAMKMVMLNQEDNTQTEMEMLDVKYDLDLDDSMFTERALKK